MQEPPQQCRGHAGDTVNTASRMESTSFPMSIQLSEAASQDLGMPDSVYPMGERFMKGKGMMVTFLAKVGAHATCSMCPQMYTDRLHCKAYLADVACSIRFAVPSCACSTFPGS